MDAIVSNGTSVRTGLLPSDQSLMGSFDRAAASFPLIPRSEWPKAGFVGLRPKATFVWDQNGYNACGGFGGAAGLTMARVAAGQSLIQLSPYWLYSQVNGGRDQGCRTEQTRQIQLEKGCALYDVAPKKIYGPWDDGVKKDVENFKADRGPLITSFDELVSAILKGVACYGGIFCGGNFNVGANGNLGNWNGSRAGGHCLAWIGGIKFENGQWYVQTLNSWGKGWGQNGWCWMPESYFDGGLPEFYAFAILSTEQLPSDTLPVAHD